MNVLLQRHIAFPIKQVASAYVDGQLCPRLVTEAALSDSVKLKSLNAFTCLTPEIALHQSKESQHRHNEKSPKSLLDGIPIAIKDNFCTANIKTTCASRMLENFVSPYDATVYARLQKAGAVLLGKTNMDEFAMGSGTVDSIYGPTKNIWSPDLSEDNWHIVGGSSGGSATAVAAGICYA